MQINYVPRRSAPWLGKDRSALLDRLQGCSGRKFWIILIVAASLVACFQAPGATSKLLLVHYMPWFVAKPYSPTWGWHWTMGHYNPDRTNSSGEREIASWYHPMIGPYDSLDPVVLEYHVLLMKLSGIDGIIADWYGMDDYNDYALIDQRTLALRQCAARARLKFCLCYEDRSIAATVKGGRYAETQAIAQAQAAILYAQTNYFNHPNYVRDANQRPVLLNFGPIYFKQSAQWAAIFAALDAANQPAFYNLDARLAVGQGAFDWPPMYLNTAGILSGEALERYLNTFERGAAGWPAFISSSFPRFHDIYHEAGAASSHGYLDDANGAIFRSTLTRALTNDCCLVQLVTWNDFGEGTVLEPTRELGYRDLSLIQEFRRHHLEPGFACRTNELSLPLRLYNLRRRAGAQSAPAAELDQVFADAVSGNCKSAEQRLARLESRETASGP